MEYLGVLAILEDPILSITIFSRSFVRVTISCDRFLRTLFFFTSETEKQKAAMFFFKSIAVFSCF
ncbi:UNVERIFIED_ORG: hypothetical protein ABIC97_004977 [Peribacillus simplex]